MIFIHKETLETILIEPLRINALTVDWAIESSLKMEGEVDPFYIADSYEFIGWL